MNDLNGINYTEAKDKSYVILANGDIILRERARPKFLRTQYPNIDDTKSRRNQKVIKNGNDDLEVKSYPKNKIKKNRKS